MTSRTDALAAAKLSDQGHPSAAYTPRRRAGMLFILFLVSTSSYLDRNIIGVALEPIKQEFGVSDTMLGLLTGASFALFYVTMGVPVARWADRGDRRIIITAALAVWSLMTALCGAATTFWQLVLARVGVGAGEAGAMAPAQGLLADYFPPSQRARAISLFMLSVTAGNFLGLAGGGWLVQNFGWRTMFLAVGLPGLLLVPLVYFTLNEPRSAAPSEVSTETLADVLKALRRKSSYVLAVGAMALFFAVAYGPLSFVVPFMIRAHDLPIGQAAAIYGACTALGGLIGNLAGGALTDRLAASEVRWLCWIPAAGMVGVCLLYQAAFLAPSTSAMIVLLFCGSLISGAAYPPMYSLLHAVCGSKRRVMAVAVALFVGNLVGIGLGPLLVGAVSDLLTPSLGAAEALRLALVIIASALAPAAFLFLGAARCVRGDLEA
ncbi:MAG: MFS transporter [Alphaproteobacteria bacterium]|nr:MFS transporter [Alphaproteobacteria bacterium]MBU1512472.1 MFS transporter [Alphaproteobacteria bacterium]MBU2096604.1 MFS transporter [Alphaproteobacteria bacterium]MBU2151578.1 MFS transporter [Alphaproteobacteria bacterium]MBU2307295.1 MFS transporter [Alphaproteobacteria bacterium]